MVVSSFVCGIHGTKQKHVCCGCALNVVTLARVDVLLGVVIYPSVYIWGSYLGPCSNWCGYDGSQVFVICGSLKGWGGVGNGVSRLRDV